MFLEVEGDLILDILGNTINLGVSSDYIILFKALIDALLAGDEYYLYDILDILESLKLLLSIISLLVLNIYIVLLLFSLLYKLCCFLPLFIKPFSLFCFMSPNSCFIIELTMKLSKASLDLSTLSGVFFIIISMSFSTSFI